MKLKVSDYARLEGITTAGVYKRHKDGKITIEESYGLKLVVEESYGLKLVVLTESDYEAKMATYKIINGHKFKINPIRKNKS